MFLETFTFELLKDIWNFRTVIKSSQMLNSQKISFPKKFVTPGASIGRCFWATTIWISVIVSHTMIRIGYMSLQYEDYEEDGVQVHPSLFPVLIGKEGAMIQDTMHKSGQKGPKGILLVWK